MLFILTLLFADLACFNVGKMVQSDDIRFEVKAVSKCKSYLPAVYVKVMFEGPGIRVQSLWPVYGVSPGKAVHHEFAFPVEAQGFTKIRLIQVVTTIEEGLSK